MKKLFLDLIPQTSWYTNLRAVLTEAEWLNVRRQVYKKYNYKCSICGGKGDKHPVEAHERWTYNFETKTQQLVDIVALCPNCHMVTHYGLAIVQKKDKIAFNHLMSVNKITAEEAQIIIKNGFEKWNGRNQIKWKVDMNWLIKYFIKNLSTKTIETLKIIK